MTSLRILAGIAPFLLGATGTASAQAAWSPDFDLPGLGLTSKTRALGTFRNELIAGTERGFASDDQRIDRIARFDGVRWRPLGKGVDGAVRAVLEWNGSLYVGGHFRVAGGMPASSIARWDGSRWHPVGAGFDGHVHALAVYRGQLHAAGDFGKSGNQVAERIASFDGQQWHPVGGGIHRVSYQPEVNCLLTANGKLYAGGQFDRAGTRSAAHVAAWDGTAWSALGTGINRGQHAIVMSLEAFGSRIVVGGAFHLAGQAAVNHIACWDGKSWRAMGPGFGNAVYPAWVSSLREFGGALYAGGSFTHVGDPANVGSFPAPRFAKWDGTRWHAVGGVSEGIAHPNFVAAATVWNNRLYLGGDFAIAGDLQPGKAIVSRFVAAFDGTRWGQVGRGLGMDGSPTSLMQWNGGVIATGPIRQAGASYAWGVAFFDGVEWRWLGTFDNIVKDAVAFGRDLVVTGSFFRVNGQIFRGAARYDGTRWWPMGQGISSGGGQVLAVYRGQVYAGGTGGPRRWNGTSWETFGSPIYGSLNAMHVHKDRLYIGGSISGSRNLVVWDGKTLAVAHGGTDGSVSALTTSGTDLVVGGAFTQAGPIAASGVARYDGSRWHQVGNGIKGGPVLALAVLRGRLYVGGNYTSYQGNTASFLSRLGSQGFEQVAGGIDGPPVCMLADDPLGRLWVGGAIRQAGGHFTTNVALLELAPQIRDVGNGLAGGHRTPILSAEGSELIPGGTLRLALSSAREHSAHVLVLGSRRLDIPFFGGTLVPAPMLTVAPIPTDAIGLSRVTSPWPHGLAMGTEFFLQSWVLDPRAPRGFAASNGLALRTP